MHTEARNGASIDRVYLHTNEGPQELNAAAHLDGYLRTIDAGYHRIVDDAQTVVCAGDDQVVWGEGGDNEHCLSLCMIGFSATIDWNTPYSQAMVERAARQVAAWCKAYFIPVTHVAAGAPPWQRGIAEHADDHCPASQGHTDPGINFPINTFVARVKTILAPPIDWKKIAELVAWEQRVTAKPLRLGDRSDDVLTLHQLLALRGYHTTIGTAYGVRLATEVAAFKAKVLDANRDGTVFGGAAAKLLLTA